MLIIGGGPAGSAAAIGLGAAGAEVTVVEARAFPRAKVCGEFISPGATGVLEALLPPGELRSAGARRVTELVLERGDRSRSWGMPTAAWTLSRGELDRRLLDRARQAGAEVLQPCRAAGVEYGQGEVCVTLGHGATIRADLVIHGDGIGRHDPAGPTPNRPGVVALKCHFRPPASMALDGIRMRSGPGAYLGTVRVEDGSATCALVTRRSCLRRCGGSPDRLVGELWPEYRPAWRHGDWLACGVPGSGYIRPGHVRSFRIGNAAAAVEPVGGEGIGLALWSGALLAQMLGRGPWTRGSLVEVHSRFQRCYRDRLRVRRPACRVAAAALMRPALVGAAWPALGVPSLTIRPWYGLTGKPLTGTP